MLSLLDAETPAQVAELFTAHAIPGAFREITATSQADRDPAVVSVSGFGGCTRFVALSLAGEKPTNDPKAYPQENRQANLGSMQHVGFLPFLASQFAGETFVEHPVAIDLLGIDLRGTLDLAVPGGVIDLKTTGEHRLQTVRRQGGPFRAHRMQVMIYAWAMANAGHDVRWVVWLYMDRASGQQTVIVDSLSMEMMDLVLDRAQEVLDFAEEPEYAPVEEGGPGTIICDSCPFLARCWGPDARPGYRPSAGGILRTDADVEATLAEYVALKEQGRKVDKELEIVEAKLMRSLPGRYGRFDWYWQNGAERLDYAQMERDYAAGVPAGTLPPKYRTKSSLRVKVLDGCPL